MQQGNAAESENPRSITASSWDFIYLFIFCSEAFTHSFIKAPVQPTSFIARCMKLLWSAQLQAGRSQLGCLKSVSVQGEQCTLFCFFSVLLGAIRASIDGCWDRVCWIGRKRKLSEGQDAVTHSYKPEWLRWVLFLDWTVYKSGASVSEILTATHVSAKRIQFISAAKRTELVCFIKSFSEFLSTLFGSLEDRKWNNKDWECSATKVLWSLTSSFCRPAYIER